MRTSTDLAILPETQLATKMKCPNCSVEIHPAFSSFAMNNSDTCGKKLNAPIRWYSHMMECPACHDPIVHLEGLDARNGYVAFKEQMVVPRGAQRPKAPAVVPSELAEDFNEAALVLADSAKASAALSRRCLQACLRQQGFTQHDLAKAIDAILATKILPSAIAENVDAIRNIGNFAAHPLKDTNSGAIVPVEPHEAEWNLDVLEALFDFFYVQPAIAKAKRDALNLKLAATGKPDLKK